MIRHDETGAIGTRAAILRAATGLFLKGGFVSTSMDEIATAAGVSKQTVYAHFGSKEALFLDVIHGLTGGAGDAHARRVADRDIDRPVEDFLLDFAVQMLTIVMTPRLMQLRRLVIGEAERFPELGKELYKYGPARSIDRLAKIIAHYSERGLVKVKDPREAASFFNWLVMGAPTNDAMLLGDSAIPSAQKLRAHAKESVRIFMAAYGPNRKT